MEAAALAVAEAFLMEASRGDDQQGRTNNMGNISSSNNNNNGNLLSMPPQQQQLLDHLQSFATVAGGGGNSNNTTSGMDGFHHFAGLMGADELMFAESLLGSSGSSGQHLSDSFHGSAGGSTAAASAQHQQLQQQQPQYQQPTPPQNQFAYNQQQPQQQQHEQFSGNRQFQQQQQQQQAPLQPQQFGPQGGYNNHDLEYPQSQQMLPQHHQLQANQQKLHPHYLSQQQPQQQPQPYEQQEPPPQQQLYERQPFNYQQNNFNPQQQQQQQQRRLNEMDILQEMMLNGGGAGGGGSPASAGGGGIMSSTTNQLLQFLAQQQQQEHNDEQYLSAQDILRMRRQEHYFTIAQNGTIVEASETITGFDPRTLLMTSIYDGVFDEDLPGFLCIKTQFWDKNQPDVEVFIRRRTIEGDWIWLSSRSIEYMDQPIPAIRLREKVVTDEAFAQRMNRITRITAILVQAVEAARLTESTKSSQPQQQQQQQQDGTVAVGGANGGNVNEPAVEPGHTIAADETAAFQALMDSISAAGAQLPDNEEALHNLMQIAATGMAPGKDGAASTNAENKQEQEMMENLAGGHQKKSFDPFSMMNSVRKGVRLDLGLTALMPEEIKMITLVLSGKLPVDEVAPLVLTGLRAGFSLKETFAGFRLDSEKASKHALALEGDGRFNGLHPAASCLHSPVRKQMPPPISVVNLSYSYIGNTGIDMLSEILYKDGSVLKTIDISFCKIEERGMLALARALAKRKKKDLPPLKGLILSGNYFTLRAAAELGTALAVESGNKRKRSRTVTKSARRGGYESDSNDSEDDDDDFDAVKKPARRKESKSHKCCNGLGLQVLHIANASVTAEALSRLLDGLGAHCPLRELNLSSNLFGAEGATVLVEFLEGKQRSREHVPMPFLDRLDMSNNNLGDDGTTQLTRAISKRSEVHLVDLKLSSNSIAASGIETIMNKLLQHNLVSLSLDKNAIGDQGCQLVAASLQSMSSLSRLNLSFNQIGSRGINSLMRSLVVCESVTYLGLSGNILRISGAIALAFTLAQHPRLEELDLDNCCLGQAAQCHIVAGIISNRWVPMKRLRGYAVGPPMVAIGALKPYAQNFSNEECFRIRKDEQMKTILRWMQNNREAKRIGSAIDPNLAALAGADSPSQHFLTPDFVSSINDVHGTPSQNAYFRLLGWLSGIPFDDDELTTLQKYFYDADGGEGDRGSDGYINLKLRGDLLAALDSEVADEIRDEFPSLAPALKGSVGIDLDKLFQTSTWDPWEAFRGNMADPAAVHIELPEEETTSEKAGEKKSDGGVNPTAQDTNSGSDTEGPHRNGVKNGVEPGDTSSSGGREKRVSKIKPRITMFPQFEQQLEELKATATEMIEQEEDPMQHEIILTQYAEASLTILRQLRYHCMNSGLDGWRKGGLKRKVLIVDDSRVTRKLVSRAFERANFIVDTASNGAEGVEKLKASIYDIAFMDIDMPVMNGFEATKKLREWEDVMRPGTRQPICALTAAYVDDFERSELMKFKEAGLDVMESKPCNIPRLFKVVDDVSPMFSDLSISVIQRERSDSKLSDASR